MDTTVRLDSNFPSLAAAFRAASTDQRRGAAKAAAEIAVAHANLGGDEIREALDVLRGRSPLPSGLRERVEALSSSLDESYFEASDNGDQARSLELFSQARAASAVAYALTPDADVLHEAIYEATVAVEDPANVVGAVERAFR